MAITKKKVASKATKRATKPVNKSPEPEIVLSPVPNAEVKAVQEVAPEKVEVKPQPPNMTSEEAAIFQRVVSETDDWKTITEEDMTDYSLMRDPMPLPKEAKELEDRKEFKFRWIANDHKRIDEVRNKPVPFRWWIANRTTMPRLDKYVNSVIGCIQSYDTILCFKPWWMHEKEVAFKRGLADSKDGSWNTLQRRDADDIKTYEGEDHRIRGNDVVMADEADFSDFIDK